MLNLEFGDRRLNKRGSLCLTRMVENPQVSFPNLFREPDELQGFYRFINNERAELGAMMDAVEEDTRQRAGCKTSAVVIHDTTLVKPPPSASALAEFSFSAGYFAHLSLLVSSENLRHVLGPAAIKMWGRAARAQKRGATRERERWFEQVEYVEKKFGHMHLTHVMDREGDICSVWSKMKEKKYSFIIRVKVNRQVLPGDKNHRLFNELEDAEVIATRELHLAKKDASPIPGIARSHPSRSSRKSVLQISCKKVEVHKTDKYAHTIEETVPINFVRVFEKNQKQQNPVEWILMTSEPIETTEDVLRIVDIYKARWIIEEYFKGLKTGCNLEARQLCSAQAWYKVTVMFLPITTRILNLRLGLETVSTFTDDQLKILKLTARKAGIIIRTPKQSHLELARLGGHIKANGPPGWATLMKGYIALLSLESGWQMARQGM